MVLSKSQGGPREHAGSRASKAKVKKRTGYSTFKRSIRRPLHVLKRRARPTLRSKRAKESLSARSSSSRRQVSDRKRRASAASKSTTRHSLHVLKRRQERQSKVQKARGRSASVKRSGLLGLKIKEKWLRYMQSGNPRAGLKNRKSIEIRGYKPSEKRLLPRRVSAPKKGDRVFLLAKGHIWGSACLGRVKAYPCHSSFDADASKHHVTPATAKGGGPLGYRAVKASLKRRGGLFGWQFSDFHWHRPHRRPKSGKTFLGDRGTVRVPDFFGQEKGAVWFNGGKLPVALDVKCDARTRRQRTA